MLRGQVEDLGGQAQEIVDQMHAQADYWTPQMQQQSAMGSASAAASQSFTPGPSPAMLRQQQQQIYQQERQLQIMQQRQQMMMAGAQIVGQQLGQMLGQALFGSGSDPAAQLAAEQARQAEEQQLAARHQAQIDSAAQMRIDWDQRDAAMSNELAGVFSTPGAKSTAFFGVGGGPDPESTLSDATAGNSVTDPNSGATAASDPSGDDAPLVVDDAAGTPSLAPEFLAAQQTRAAETAAFESSLSSWERTSTPAPPVPADDWAAPYAEKFKDYAVGQIADKIKSTSVYSNFTNTLQYVPGYEWAVKAKSAYDYAQGLRGKFDALYNPYQTEVNKTLGAIESSTTAVAVYSASGQINASGLEDQISPATDEQANGFDGMAMSGIKGQVKSGLSNASSRDAAIQKPSDEVALIRPVSGESNSYVRRQIWQQQPGANLNEAGYP
jgi:hypothetical protein